MTATLIKDIYKEFHPHVLHPDVTHMYGNFTSRSGRLSNVKNNERVAFVGLQYFILDFLIEEFNTTFFQVDKDEAIAAHSRIASSIVGYKVNTTHLEALWDLGYLPLEIKALPEGSLVPYQVAPLTIVNTVEGFGWLPLMIETVMSTENWGIQTSCTTSVAYYKAFKAAFERTGAPMELLPFMGHDFSMRGMMGRHAAATSGFGHLASGFAGTDTIPAVMFAEKYYGANVDTELVGASVNATEHSVTCAWMQEGEVAFVRSMFAGAGKTGILSFVSDTWDFWKFVTEHLVTLKDEIMARDGKFVIRPDSGDPVDILCGIKVEPLGDWSTATTFEEWKVDVADEVNERFCDNLDAESPHQSETNTFSFQGKVYDVTYEPDLNRHDKQYYYVDNYGDDVSKCTFVERELSPEDKGLIECLWDIFGGTTTEQGYKLLDDHIGAIYGDAITLDRQAQIIARLEAKGFVPMVVLGIGSYSFQYVTRDTHGSAVKATNMIKNGRSIPIFKDPKTDSKKKSAKGLLRVEKDDELGFVMYDEQTPSQEAQGELQTVFLNGEIVKRTTLAEIRERVQVQL